MARRLNLARFAHNYAQWLGLPIQVVGKIPEVEGLSNPNAEACYLPSRGLLLAAPVKNGPWPTPSVFGKSGTLTRAQYRRWRTYSLLHEVNHFACASKKMRRMVDFGLAPISSRAEAYPSKLTRKVGSEYRDDDWGIRYVPNWSDAHEMAVADMDFWVMAQMKAWAHLSDWEQIVGYQISKTSWIESPKSLQTIYCQMEGQDTPRWQKLTRDQVLKLEAP